ncbi:MAG: TIM-barrel domain-containing protein [bacterium]
MMIHKLFYILFFIFLWSNVKSQQIIDYQINGNVLKVNCIAIDYEIQAYTNNIVKINSYLDKIHLKDSSYTVILKPEAVNVEILKDGDYIYFKTDSLTLRIPLDYFGIDFIKDELLVTGQIKNSFFRFDDMNGCYFSLKEDEGIYGLGFKAVDINRRKLKTILYNQNVIGYEYGESWLNSNVPLFISSENYGIFVDNHALHYYNADSSKPNAIKYNVNSGNMSYFFISGNDYVEIINLYCKLTGFQPLLPRWACGFILSKVSYQNQDNCIKIVNKMLQNDFPLEALVFDYSWFGFADNMGNFSWNKSAYPNPEILISDLKQKKIKTILISEPFVSKKSVNYSDAVSKNLFVKDTNGLIPTVHVLGSDVVLLDIFKKDTKDWIWNKYLERIMDGVEGWWIDTNEPEFHGFHWVHEIGNSLEHHNIYSLVWAQNLFEKYRNEIPDKRPFLMHRAGWAGAQRYGSVLTCGDENRNWSALKAQIPGMLGMQMSGLSMFSTDVAGFFGNWDINSELYIRWFQFGTFSPIMRLHMGGTDLVEPFHHDKRTQDIVREFIKLRYKLLPYNYTLFWENSETGTPLARPMNFYNDDLKFRNVNDQYYWGKEFLVAPIVDTNIRKRQVLLPKGRWIDYWTKNIYDGDLSITIDAPLENIPLLVKLGSFIPTLPQIYNTEDYKGDTLIIEYYPHIDNPVSQYTMYEDDGITPDANKKEQFQLLNFSGLVTLDSIVIRQSITGSYPNNPVLREMFYKIFNPGLQYNSVTINKIKLESAQTKEEFALLPETFYIDKENNLLEIHFRFLNTDSDILITNEPNNVDDSGNLTEIKVYPVPGKEYLNLEIKGIEEGKYLLAIFNIEGQKISGNLEIIAANETLNIKLDFNKYPSLFTKGVYYLSLSGKDFNKYVKFSVE